MTSETNHATEYFLNKLTQNNIDYIDIIGLNVAILYSKDIFNRNKDISEFLDEVYDISFLPYVMKSRTLIVARITKELNNKDKDELNEIRNSLFKYLSPNMDNSENISKSKSRRTKKDSNEKLKSWLEGM